VQPIQILLNLKLIFSDFFGSFEEEVAFARKSEVGEKRIALELGNLPLAPLTPYCVPFGIDE